MLGAWLRFWRRLLFWPLPDSDTSDGSGWAQRPKQQTAGTTADAEVTEVAATATSQPDDVAEPDDIAGRAPATPADDLTVIDGIGPGIARRLKGLGIKTFADLSAASPDDLVAKLQVQWVTTRRTREWIAEAAKRVRS